jgi:hypothetical protein
MKKIEKTSYGFPLTDGVGAGCISHVMGGYLGQTQDGIPFIIGDAENLVSTFKDMAEKLAWLIMEQLDGEKNLNKLVNFTFMIDDRNSLIPADLPEAQKKILLQIINGFRVGKFDDATDVELIGALPITIINPGDIGNEKKLKTEDGIGKDGLNKIHEASKTGATIIIEKGNGK